MISANQQWWFPHYFVHRERFWYVDHLDYIFKVLASLSETRHWKCVLVYMVSCSPLTVSSLTNGHSYSFTVFAVTSAGNGLVSAASNAVVPGILFVSFA